jgi:hypothetical protein
MTGIDYGITGGRGQTKSRQKVLNGKLTEKSDENKE